MSIRAIVRYNSGKTKRELAEVIRDIEKKPWIWDDDCKVSHRYPAISKLSQELDHAENLGLIFCYKFRWYVEEGIPKSCHVHTCEVCGRKSTSFGTYCKPCQETMRYLRNRFKYIDKLVDLVKAKGPVK